MRMSASTDLATSSPIAQTQWAASTVPAIPATKAMASTAKVGIYDVFFYCTWNYGPATFQSATSFWMAIFHVHANVQV